LVLEADQSWRDSAPFLECEWWMVSRSWVDVCAVPVHTGCTVQPVRGSVHVHSEVRQRRSCEVPVRPRYQDRAHRTAPATKSRPGIARTQDRAASGKDSGKRRRSTRVAILCGARSISDLRSIQC
jgi:hypothetical protein